MRRIKTREFLRRTLTDVFSMSPWPLEMAGAFLLWHYSKLFSSGVRLSNDFSTILSDVMPNNSWSIFARVLAYGLWVLGALSVTTGAQFYALRIALALSGLIAWSVLAYSCWRSNVAFDIYELYVFCVVAQAYTATLLRARQRKDAKDGS